jgi:hypothetical protein
VTFAPGQSGNPSGWQGGRQRRHREIFDEIKKLGHRDALLTLSTIQHTTQDESLKIAAAAALAPYAHPKLQSLPCPVFISNPIDLPPPTSIEIAKDNISKLIAHYGKGEIDQVSYDKLIAGNVAMINALLGQDKLAYAHGEQGEQTIRIENTLPQIPSTTIIGFESYPVVGKRTNQRPRDRTPTPRPPDHESVKHRRHPTAPAANRTKTPRRAFTGHFKRGARPP